jgi:hypothetical protein
MFMYKLMFIHTGMKRSARKQVDCAGCKLPRNLTSKVEVGNGTSLGRSHCIAAWYRLVPTCTAPMLSMDHSIAVWYRLIPSCTSPVLNTHNQNSASYHLKTFMYPTSAQLTTFGETKDRGEAPKGGENSSARRQRLKGLTR